MWVAFAKATHIFFSKNTCELDIILIRTVNILTSDKLVKLTMFWTIGPRFLKKNSKKKKYFVGTPILHKLARLWSKDAPHAIWVQLALQFQSCLYVFTIHDDGCQFPPDFVQRIYSIYNFNSYSLTGLEKNCLKVLAYMVTVAILINIANFKTLVPNAIWYNWHNNFWEEVWMDLSFFPL